MEFLPRTLLYYMLSHGYLCSALLRHTKKRRLVLAAFPFFVVMGLFPYIHGLLPDGSMAQKIFARTGPSGSRWLFSVCWLFPARISPPWEGGWDADALPARGSRSPRRHDASCSSCCSSARGCTLTASMRRTI